MLNKLKCNFYKAKTQIINTVTQKNRIEEKAAQSILTFRLADEVNLYEVLPVLSFTTKESVDIIHGLGKSKSTLQELVQYIGGQRKQQQYNNYKGVVITPEYITALKAMIRE